MRDMGGPAKDSHAREAEKADTMDVGAGEQPLLAEQEAPQAGVRGVDAVLSAFDSPV